jgi:AmiR/NasT family two-component response regulator
MYKAIRVLIVEDEPLVSAMVRRTLENIGYTVVGEAIDGLQAIEMTQALRPDVILMDLDIPCVDGIEATRYIHEHFPTPVVVLTAYETQELVEKASAAGAGAYLIKPSDMHEVERAITIARARFYDLMELRRTNAELDRFTNTVSHDLKSPLIIINGFLDLLKQDMEAGDHERMKINMAYISDAAEEMQQLLDELGQASYNGQSASPPKATLWDEPAHEAMSLAN